MYIYGCKDFIRYILSTNKVSQSVSPPPSLISPYLQYPSNLTKDISLLVYCLTMFDVCHMFVLKYYLRPIFNSF